MSNITISNLNPTDSDILSQSYMVDLSENELESTNGGWVGALIGAVGTAVTIYGTWFR